jgi:hypothetical protein
MESGLKPVLAPPDSGAINPLLETYRSEQAALVTTTAVEPHEKRIVQGTEIGG